MKYSEMSKEQLQNEYTKVRAEYDSWCQQNLSLDMAREKPGPDQMDLSLELFDLVNTKTGFKNFTGIDCRNYGGLDGLIELKNLFSEIMGVAPQSNSALLKKCSARQNSASPRNLNADHVLLHMI